MWRAFNQLSTTRQRGFSLGPISYREVEDYARALDLGEAMSEFLWDVVKKLDEKFRSMIAEKTAKSNKTT